MSSPVAASKAAATGGGAAAAAAAAAAANSGVQVFVRLRGFNKRERDISAKAGDSQPECVVVFRDKQTCVVMDLSRDEKGFRTSKEREAFSFDECFSSIPPGDCEMGLDVPFADQKYVYERTGRLCLDNAMLGLNSCLFAYGQTGSGKSYSMIGSDDQPGNIPRICDEVFSRVAAIIAGAPTRKIIIETMFFEVYNEKVRDLYNKKSNPNEFDAVKIRQHPTKGVYIEGLIRKEVSSGDEIKALLEKGSKERAMSATNMNATSSRSHAIFQIQITQNDASKGTQTTATMNLVDLAGSEKVRDSGVTGDAFKEAKNINLSLSTLRKVIDCLIDNATSKKKKVPPYRESVLTYVLSESLGGNSKTMMISAISPHEVNTEDTLNTLRYALRAKAIVCTPKVNEEKSAAMMDAMRDELRKMREALASGLMPDGSMAAGFAGEARPMMPEEIKAEIEAREQEMAKMENEQKEMQELLEKSKQREEELNQQMAEVAEQRAQLDIQVEQKKREQFAAAFRSAFLITKDKQRFKLQVKELDEAKEARTDAEETAARARKQLEDVKNTCETKVKELEAELVNSEARVKTLFEEGKAEREKIRAALQAQVTKLEGDLATSNEIVEAVKQESHEELTSARTRMKSQIANLEKEIAHLKEEHVDAAHAAQIAAERAQRTYAERTADLEARLNDATSDASKARADARSARDAAREQSQQLLKRIADLEAEVEQGAEKQAAAIRDGVEKQQRRSAELSQRVAELEKDLAASQSKAAEQRLQHQTASETLTRSHQAEVADMKSKHDAAARALSQQLGDATREAARLKAELDLQLSEQERSVVFERNLREETLRDAKAAAERIRSQLHRRVSELEVEVQTLRTAAEHSVQAAASQTHQHAAEKERAVEAVRERLRAAEQHLEVVKGEKDAALQAERAQQQAKYGALQTELSAKIAQLEQQVRDAREGQTRLQSHLDFKMQQFDAEVKDLAQLNDDIRRESRAFLESQLSELRDRITEAQSQLDAERGRHRDALAVRDRAVAEKTARLAELEREQAAAREGRAALEDELQHSKVGAESLRRDLEQRLGESATEAAELRQARTDAETRALDAQRAMRGNVARVSELERELQTTKAALDSKSYALEQAQDRLRDEYADQLVQLKAELSNTEQQLTAASADARALRAAAASSAREMQQTKLQLANSQATAARLQEQLSTGHEKVVSELREQVAGLRAERDTALAAQEQLELQHRTQIAARDSRVAELSSEAALARQALQLFDAESAKRIGLIEGHLQQRSASADGELRVLREALRTAEREGRSARADCAAAQQKAAALETQLADARRRHTLEMEQAESSASRASQLARQQMSEQKLALSTELESLRKQVTTATIDHKRAVEEASTAHRSEVFHLKQQLTAATTECASLHAKLIEGQQALLAQQKDQDKAMSELRASHQLHVQNLQQNQHHQQIPQQQQHHHQQRQLASSAPPHSSTSISSSAFSSAADGSRVRELEEALRLLHETYDGFKKDSKDSAERVREALQGRIAELEGSLRAAHQDLDEAAKQEAAKTSQLKAFHAQAASTLEQRVEQLLAERQRTELEATERTKAQYSHRVTELEQQLRAASAEHADAQRSAKIVYDKIQQQLSSRCSALEEELRTAIAGRDSSAQAAASKQREDNERVLARRDAELRELRDEAAKLRGAAARVTEVEQLYREANSRLTSLQHQLLESESARDTLSAGHGAEITRLKLQFQTTEADLRAQLDRAAAAEQELRNAAGNKTDTARDGLHSRVAQLEAALAEVQEAQRRSSQEHAAECETIRQQARGQVELLEGSLQAASNARDADTKAFRDKMKALAEEHRLQIERESQASKQLVESAIFNAKMSQQAAERVLQQKVTDLENRLADTARDLSVAQSKADSQTHSLNRTTQRAASAEDQLSATRKEHERLQFELSALKAAGTDAHEAHQRELDASAAAATRTETALRQMQAEHDAEMQKRASHFADRESALQAALKTAQDSLEASRRDSKAAIERIKVVCDGRVQELEHQLNDKSAAAIRSEEEHIASMRSLETLYQQKLRDVAGVGSGSASPAGSPTRGLVIYDGACSNAELENQIRALQLVAEQARQARDAAERQVSLEQNRIVMLEAELNAASVKRDMHDADIDSLKAAQAKQIAHLQSHARSLESDVIGARHSNERMARDVSAEREAAHAAAERAKDLAHKLHMAELKQREALDALAAERVSHEQKAGELERRIQEALFQKERAERHSTDAIERAKAQADRRINELEVALVNATSLSGSNAEALTSDAQAASSAASGGLSAMQLREQNHSLQLRVAELEKEIHNSKAAAARAEHDFNETYARVKEQASRRVQDAERELHTLRLSMQSTQKDAKEAMERSGAQAGARVAELERELQFAISGQMTLREEAKVLSDRAARNHQAQVAELEQRLQSAQSSTEAAQSDLALQQTLRAQAEKRCTDLAAELRRGTEQLERTREEHRTASDRASSQSRLERAELEKQLAAEKQLRAENSKELTAAREKLSTSLQQRIGELENLLQSANEHRAQVQGEMDALRRSHSQLQAQSELRAQELNTRLQIAHDDAARAKADAKDLLAKQQDHHTLRLTEAERKSPHGRALDQLQQLQEQVRKREVQFAQTERALRESFDQELVGRYQREHELESENQQLRLAVQQQRNTSEETKKKLHLLEREHRLHGLEASQAGHISTSAMSALESARQRIREQQQLMNGGGSVKSLGGGADAMGSTASTPVGEGGGGWSGTNPLEISHMFTLQKQLPRGKTTPRK